MERKEKIGTRTLDELGRIVIPAEARAKLDWGEKDTIDMYYADENTLLLQLAEKYSG